MPYLATLAQAKSDAKLTDTTSDSFLTSALEFVSNRIETINGQWYEPRRDSLYFDASIYGRVSWGGKTLDLNMPLVELYGVTLGDATVMSLSDIRLYPRGQTPASQLIITNNTYSFMALTDGDVPDQAIEVSGAWCYHTEYNRSAWSILSTLSAGINTSVTTITPVSVASFSVGQLLRIDDEYLRVTAVGGSTLTVIRAINGTTAAAHDSADSIYVFYPEPAIQRAALRWAAFLLARRAAYERVNYDGINTTTFPPDMPDEVRNIMSELPRPLTMLGG